MSNYTKAYNKLFGNAVTLLTTDECAWNEPVYDKIRWGNEVVPAINIPTKAQVEAKIVELQNIEPFRLLREKRNKKLFDSDYRIIADFPHPSEEVKQAWITYRQELRDLPSNSTPSLDDNGELTNVTWPTQPS